MDIHPLFLCCEISNPQFKVHPVGFVFEKKLENNVKARMSLSPSLSISVSEQKATAQPHCFTHTVVSTRKVPNIELFKNGS